MKIKISKAPPQNGLSVEGGKYQSLSSDGINLLGDYHKNGGTMVSSNGELVEAERNEPIYSGSDGDNYVFGNVRNPLTGKAFKNEGRQLLKEKGLAERKMAKANDIISTSDPHSKFGSLDFNTGQVQLDAAQMQVNTLKGELDGLAQIQDNLLSYAEQTGADPKQIGNSMKKNGGKIKVRMGGMPQAKDGKTLMSIIEDAYKIPDLPWLPKPEVATPQAAAQTTAPVQPATPMESVVPNSQGTLAQRNNNPGNLRFNNQTGAFKGDAGFAKFNSYEDGYQALLNDLRAKQTGKTRTGLGPNSTIRDLMNVYSPASDNNDPQRLATTLAQGFGVGVNTPIGQLDTKKLADLIAINEDQAYAASKGNTPVRNNVSANPRQQAPPSVTTGEGDASYSPIFSPNGPITPLESATPQPLQVAPMEGQPMTQLPYQAPAQTVSQPSAKGPKRSTLSPLNYLGELAAIFDQPDYVQGQQYDPNLMTPYRVSLQDQINQNTASFNSIARSMANNPEALATLAGQKYQQDQQVLANEFRMNQGVQNQVLNQNNQILNQAALTNLQLDDQQYVRQAQAQAATDANRQAALASISNKYSQNALENNRAEQIFNSQERQANMYGNMYQNYKFDQQGNVLFQDNGGYDFNYGGFGNTDQSAHYRYLAQQEQLKKQAKIDAARNVSQKSFGYKFK